MRIIPYEFGKEDRTMVTDDILKNILISHYRGILRLIKYIYFNPNYRKNCTIKFKFSDEHNLYIYEEGMYKPLPKDYILDTIIIDAWKILYNYFEKINRDGTLINFRKSLVCNQTFDRIQDFIISYNNICEGNVDESFTDIKNDIYNFIKVFYSKAYYKRKLLRKKTS